MDIPPSHVQGQSFSSLRLVFDRPSEVLEVTVLLFDRRLFDVAANPHPLESQSQSLRQRRSSWSSGTRSASSASAAPHLMRSVVCA